MSDQTVDRTAVLIATTEVRTVRGEVLYLKTWGVRTGMLMLQRIKTMLLIATQAQSGSLDLNGLMASSGEELVGIVADSFRIKVAELEDEDRFLFEDFLFMLSEVVRVNFVERPGMVAKLLGLLKMAEMAFMPQEAVAPAGDVAPADPTEGTGTPKPSST